jgi:hypothetical protein
MGQESLTRFDQPKKKKQTKPKSAVEKQTGENKIIANNKKSKYHPIRCKRKETNNKKIIIITKNEAKNSIFSF